MLRVKGLQVGVAGSLLNVLQGRWLMCCKRLVHYNVLANVCCIATSLSRLRITMSKRIATSHVLQCLSRGFINDELYQ